MAVNCYATLTEYKNYAIARGQTATTDATDDAVILSLIEQASRYLDDKTGRQFFPSMETRSYDTPGDNEILFGADLLSLTTLTNGDAMTITSTDYTLLPASVTPKYSVKLKDISSLSWETNSSDSAEQVISVAGVWGYRDHYSARGWLSGGMLGAAITDTTSLSFTMAGGHTIAVGQILKIDSELLNVSAVSTNTVTVLSRGDNSSTAATHLISSVVYVWQPQEQAKAAVLEMANSAYERRYGKATGESAQVTAAGVVLTPRDIPKMAEEFIRIYRRLV